MKILTISFLLLFIVACVDSADEVEYENSLPNISNITATPEIIFPDSLTLIRIAASDPDKLDSLRYSWDADAGVFINNDSDTTHASIFWKAPQAEGNYKIFATVSDKVGSTKDTLTVFVTNTPFYPITPTLVSPKNNAIKTANSIDLTWQTYSPKGKKLTFDIYFGKTPSLVKIDSNLNNLYYTISNLKYSTNYNWKIIAKYDETHVTESEIFTFTTRDLASGTLTTDFVSVSSGKFYSPYIDTNSSIVNYNFQIMKYEVTTKQYIDFLNSLITTDSLSVDQNFVKGFYDGNSELLSGYYVFLQLDSTTGITYSNKTFQTNKPDLPISGVSWIGADAFAKYYNLTLPTFEEWIRAAQGNSKFAYPLTDTLKIAMANFSDSLDTDNDGKFDYYGSIADGKLPVGSYNGTTLSGKVSITTQDFKTEFGAYDMIGNVAEWINSPSAKVKNVCGGGFKFNASSSKVWYRFEYPIESTLSYIGFRCVKK